MRGIEINKYVKILNAVLMLEDELYYLQDCAGFVH